MPVEQPMTEQRGAPKKREKQRQQQWEPRRRARRRALQALYQQEISGDLMDDIIIQFTNTQDFSGVDTDYFKALVHGVDRERAALVEALQPVLDRDFARLDTMERILLGLGAWQFRFELDVPFQVVIDETVDLANRFGSTQSPAYVNAVLDKAARSWGLPGTSTAGQV